MATFPSGVESIDVQKLCNVKLPVTMYLSPYQSIE